jgi:DivIVA domain-containing protein
MGEQRDRLLSEVRNVSFPITMRGYDRQAVDNYVVQVNDLIAELDATRSPDAAVKRALESIGEQTGGILRRAQETASQITEQAQADADDRLHQAEHEAQAIREGAEKQAHQLENDLQSMRKRRDDLIEDIRALADKLFRLADAAGNQTEATGARADTSRASEGKTQRISPVNPPRQAGDDQAGG